MDKPNDKPKSQAEQTEELSEKAYVAIKLQRIKDAKTKHDPDYKRMKKNSEFAFGIQGELQEKLDCEEYRANWTNREVNQKVSALYARDPKAIARRRKRMDFQLWDEDPMTEMAAQSAMQQSQMMGMPPNPQAEMLLQDIAQGKDWRKLVDRVGRTMEILYQYECDTQMPDFKYQMKQLVRRVITCGVGYVRLHFVRLGQPPLTSTGTDDSIATRVKRMKHLVTQLNDDVFQKDDARYSEIEDLMSSIKSSLVQGDHANLEERLEFDFPSATSIIVDPQCKSLKGFIGARWIVQQYIVPLDFVRAYFELTDLAEEGEGSPTIYREDGVEQPKASAGETKKDPTYKPMVCLWEMFELDTKSCCFLMDGYKKYVSEPYPCDPIINRFWPIFSLTFNDVEVEGGTKASIFPPSDVDLLKSPQKEWNRVRQALAEHRQENAPFYVTKKGWLTSEGPDSDLEKLKNHESGEVIELEGTPPDGDVGKALVAFQPAQIDPRVYDTTPLELDATLVVGSDQPQAPPKAKTAATPAVIEEQKRISGTNSNVDDLDDLLSELARAAGEIMLREFSVQTVQHIVGRGCTWPPENQREDFLNEINLDIVASSSGRPNKAVEIANFERLAPILAQAGASPWGLIKEAITRLDDRLEVSDFAPTQPPNPTPPPKPKGPNGSPHGPAQGGGQPLQPNMGQQPVPLPGH